MASVPIIDPHMHLWNPGVIRYPWLEPPFDESAAHGSVERLARPYLEADYCNDAEGWHVCATVHVEAGAAVEQATDESRWIQDRAEQHGLVKAFVASARLEAPNLDQLLEQHCQFDKIRGIRHLVHWHPEPGYGGGAADVTLAPEWQAGFARLSRYGLRFDLQAYPNQFSHLSRLFAANPDVPVIVNHTGLAVPVGENWRSIWRDGMRALASLPHVSLKISGVGFVWPSWSVDMIRDHILEAIDIFGVSRIMFASNYPTDSLFNSFDAHYKAYDAITSSFSHTERCKLFAGNANEIYDLNIPLSANDAG